MEKKIAEIPGNVSKFHLSERGIELIRHFEGLKLKAYKDSRGIWTIGIGTTVYPNGTRVKQGDVITESEAIAYFKHDVLAFEKDVKRLIKKHITQNQFDALVSFRYNAGCGYYSGKTFKNYNIWQHVNDNTLTRDYWEGLAVTAGSKTPVGGLLRRRRAETILFFDSKLVFS